VKEAIERLREIDREIYRLSEISAALGWDQETYMPPGALNDRAEQQSIVEGMIHERITSAEVGNILEKLGVDLENLSADLVIDGLEEIDNAFVREIARFYKRETKLPKKLVEEYAREASISQSRWVEARKASDFSIFKPHLEKVLSLKCEIADLIGYEKERYDALLDSYEPWMKTEELLSVFERFEGRIKEFVKRIVASGKKVNNDFLYRSFDRKKQEEFGRFILGEMGFDFERGRLDVSAHPFTTSLGFADVRLTTRYNEKDFKSGLFGIIHEGGHGLYEQGFSEKLIGILADGTSMGIHESQSRMWENLVGRSLPFWKAYFPKLKETFPGELSDVSLEDFYRGINEITPSLIRVEADEVTYNLHIIIRFKLERELLNGKLKVQDLPEAWNSEYSGLLGIKPPNDADGVLQDIHWSHGYFGYFPTYSLGNLYSAQFFAKMKSEIPGLEDEIGKGNLQVVLSWLREKIHRHGRVYPATKLCMEVTGETLDPDYFMKYLEGKYQDIY